VTVPPANVNILMPWPNLSGNGAGTGI